MALVLLQVLALPPLLPLLLLLRSSEPDVSPTVERHAGLQVVKVPATESSRPSSLPGLRLD